MKIVADRNIPLLDELFGQHGEIHRLNGRDISRSDLMGADALLIRSVTHVNQQLIQKTGVRFVGSATIGTDHLDIVWLEAGNIPWAYAPGCNADAVAQYALAMMWLSCERLDQDFFAQTVGIIGRGNVGGRLQRLLAILNIPVESCDPPLHDAGEQHLVSMQQACANRIVSLHVPLTRSGKYPTAELFDHRQLSRLDPGTLLVNTARGGIIEKSGLQDQLQTKRIHAALDVWPDEPFIDSAFVEAVSVATPHVAGYSIEGKRAGTEMIYREFCKAFSLQAASTPQFERGNISTDLTNIGQITKAIKIAVQASCLIARDDATLRNTTHSTPGDDRIQIDSLRANYTPRQEFSSHSLRVNKQLDTTALRQLGFNCI